MNYFPCTVLSIWNVIAPIPIYFHHMEKGSQDTVSTLTFSFHGRVKVVQICNEVRESKLSQNCHFGWITHLKPQGIMRKVGKIMERLVCVVTFYFLSYWLFSIHHSVGANPGFISLYLWYHQANQKGVKILICAYSSSLYEKQQGGALFIPHWVGQSVLSMRCKHKLSYSVHNLVY